MASYTVNERVLAWHGKLLYDAKIQEMEPDPEHEGYMRYLIHYKGWKKSWDEFVPPSRLLELNEDNVKEQKRLMIEYRGKAQSGANGASGTKDKTKTPRKEVRGVKRGREASEDDTGNAKRRKEIALIVPDDLRMWLVDDWEGVTKDGKLVQVPRTPCTRDILKEFADHIRELPDETAPPSRDPLLDSIVSGIQTYFDKSLGSRLLYRQERNQYGAMRKQFVTGAHVIVEEQKEMSQIYGAEHLLRMLVVLPTMVASSNIDDDSIEFVRIYVDEFLRFLSQHRERLFQSMDDRIIPDLGRR